MSLFCVVQTIQYVSMLQAQGFLWWIRGLWLWTQFNQETLREMKAIFHWGLRDVAHGSLRQQWCTAKQALETAGMELKNNWMVMGKELNSFACNKFPRNQFSSTFGLALWKQGGWDGVSTM